MKAIKIGTKIEIYNDTVMTFNELPARTYIVRFEKMSGFYLDEYAEAEIKEDKIYGEHMNKVKKVLRTYRAFNRNLGVILSGFKGIGKSKRLISVSWYYLMSLTRHLAMSRQARERWNHKPRCLVSLTGFRRERSCLSLHVMMSGNSMILLLTDRDGFTIIFASSTRLRRKSGHICRIS